MFQLPRQILSNSKNHEITWMIATMLGITCWPKLFWLTRCHEVYPLLSSPFRPEAEKKWLMIGDKTSSFAPGMEPYGKEKGLQSSWVPRVAGGCPRLLCGSAWWQSALRFYVLTCQLVSIVGCCQHLPFPFLQWSRNHNDTIIFVIVIIVVVIVVVLLLIIIKTGVHMFSLQNALSCHPWKL